MYNFYRMQMEVIRQADGTYARPVLQLCWKKPIVDDNGEPIPPYVENGITDIVLAEHTELQSLIEQATALVVPVAISKLNAPISTQPMPETQIESTP